MLQFLRRYIHFVTLLTNIAIYEACGLRLAIYIVVKCAVAWLLVHLTPEWVLRAQVLSRDIVLRSWGIHFTLIVPLSTQVYKWVPANLLLGLIYRWTSIPSCGEEKYPGEFSSPQEENPHPIPSHPSTPSCFMLLTRICSGPTSHLACMQTSPLPCGSYLSAWSIDKHWSYKRQTVIQIKPVLWPKNWKALRFDYLTKSLINKVKVTIKGFL